MLVLSKRSRGEFRSVPIANSPSLSGFARCGGWAVSGALWTSASFPLYREKKAAMLVRMAAERHIERDIELVLRALADPERDALQRLLARAESDGERRAQAQPQVQRQRAAGPSVCRSSPSNSAFPRTLMLLASMARPSSACSR